MTASFILTKTGRDALYFQKDGLFDLPWAYLGIATLAVPVAMMTLSLTKRLGLRPMRIVLPLTVALVQAVFYVVAEPGGGVVMTLFFMSIPLIYGVMFSTTWLFGGELVETLPKERLSLVYGRLGINGGRTAWRGCRKAAGSPLGGIGVHIARGCRTSSCRRNHPSRTCQVSFQGCRIAKGGSPSGTLGNDARLQ